MKFRFSRARSGSASGRKAGKHSNGERWMVALLFRRARSGSASCGVFLAAIVAANLITTRYGPSASIYNAFFLIGLDFITRDRLADFWGTTRWAKMAALILAGGAISYYLNRHAGPIAEASCVAFAAAETVEAVLYHFLRRQQWVERAPKAALAAAAVDSLVFPTIAFGGVMWSITFGQFFAKVAGAFVWAIVVQRFLRPPRVAPAKA